MGALREGEQAGCGGSGWGCVLDPAWIAYLALQMQSDEQRTDDSAAEPPPRATTAPPLRSDTKPRGVLPPERAPRLPERRAQGSTLAAEVRALDAARREIAAGRPDRALAAVAAFHRDFPRAQLAADAEGLAIEALLARDDREAAVRRARRFLRNYPGDPHAPRFEPIAAEH